LHQIICCPCLKMEAEPASKTSCFIKRLDDGQSSKREHYVSESYTIVCSLKSWITPLLCSHEMLFHHHSEYSLKQLNFQVKWWQSEGCRALKRLLLRS
jgi:hypothetical protein